VELNPTWTVPPGIVDEVLAETREDPSYLERQGLRVLDRSGNLVDPSTIDFTTLTEEDFPWILRQDPGPLNPLGRVKFVFPNEQNVYLHDTPRRELFDREERLFSHGCIRVQSPFALAELLIDDPTRWDRSKLESASLLGESLVIPLARPLPVLIEYWTASVDESGVLHFYRDVYGRDPAVLAALGRS
jgi:murein L,D-transpeptidase YcbB/YkuD